MTYRKHSVLAWIGLIAAVLIVVGTVTIATFELRKAYWDRKVEDLCAKEGGIKVLRTVPLSPGEYAKLLNRNNQFDLPPERSAAPGQRYVYSTTTDYLARNGLEVKKMVTRVLDRSGPVVLAEKVEFSRVGGDLFVLDSPSSFRCPPLGESLFGKPFIKRQGEEK